MTDRLSRTYADLLDGQYDCLDRIVLNGYHRLAHNPGGFLLWWRQLRGSPAPLDNAHLRHMAGRFRRQLRVWARAHRVPISRPGRVNATMRSLSAIARIVPNRGSSLSSKAGHKPLFGRSCRASSSATRSPNPYVTHFSFHILDPDWGHLTIKLIKLSSQPPFPAQIILNGHEYLERQAQKAGVPFTKEGNCFTALPDESRFAPLAETLTEDTVAQPLVAVCDRWIYTCLGCALSAAEQKRSRFRYEYSLYQMEYSRNLLFRKESRCSRSSKRSSTAIARA